MTMDQVDGSKKMPMNQNNDRTILNLAKFFLFFRLREHAGSRNLVRVRTNATDRVLNWTLFLSFFDSTQSHFLLMKSLLGA